MKKLIASFFAATLLGSGLAAVSTSPAAAAKYPNSVTTRCGAYAIGTPKNDRQTKIRAEVSAPSTTQNPRGWIEITVRKFNGRDGGNGRFFTRGGPVQLRFGPLRPGRYSGSMYFDSRPGASKFKDCTDGFFFRVRRVK